MVFPETLGACADLLYELKEQAATISRQLDAIDEQRKALEDHLINTLPKSDANGIVGHKARATIQKKEVATVKDWSALYELILASKDFSLLQRRVSDSAVKERWAHGETVAGCEPFTVLKISLTKI